MATWTRSRRSNCSSTGKTTRRSGLFERNFGLDLFLITSGPLRLVRFLLVTGLTMAICRWLQRLDLRGRRVVHAVAWTTFYAGSFAAVGW